MAVAINQFCAIFAAAMAIILGLLILRRLRAERSQSERAEVERRVTRSYLRRINNLSAPNDTSKSYRAARLDAVSHLSQLVRGSERDRLLSLIEADGLLDAVIASATRGSFKRRMTAVHLLEQFGGDRCVETLTDVMASETTGEVRITAAAALARLGRLPPPFQTISFLEMQGKTPNLLHLTLFRSLAVDHADVLREIAQQNTSPAFRSLLIEALGWCKDADMLPALAAWSKSPHVAERCATLKAAAHIGHPAVAPWVHALLADADPDVRALAIETASSLGLRKSLPAIRAMMSDPSRWVRVHAQKASLGFAAPVAA